MTNFTVVVGGTKGIGGVIAQMFRDRGDQVVTVSRSGEMSERHIVCDLSAVDSSLLARQAPARIDYLVFSQRYRGASWEEEFQVTLDGTRRVIEALLPHFSSPGAVAFVSSNAKQFIFAEQPAQYHASRAAVEALLKYYAVKYGKQGIRFNSIVPSTVIKPENYEFYDRENQVRKDLEAVTPLGRMGTATDIASAVEFLCSERSSFITGASLLVDGGISLIAQESSARKPY